jgi:hypothetical protein
MTEDKIKPRGATDHIPGNNASSTDENAIAGQLLILDAHRYCKAVYQNRPFQESFQK